MASTEIIMGVDSTHRDINMHTAYDSAHIRKTETTKKEILMEMLTLSCQNGHFENDPERLASGSSTETLFPLEHFNASRAKPEALARLFSQVAQGTGEEKRIILQRKQTSDRFGLRITKVGHCLFIISIRAGFLADIAGLRFGDQIMEINNTPVGPLSVIEATDKLLENANAHLLIRKQPHVISCTVPPSLKASSLGVTFEHGEVKKISKLSPLYTAGVLPGYVIVQVNGRNAVGLRGHAILELIKKECGTFFTVQIMTVTTFRLLTCTVDLSAIAKEMY